LLALGKDRLLTAERNGRQAPVKRCLARFAAMKPQLRCEDAISCAFTKNKNLEAVRHHLPDGVDIRLVYLGQLLELAHTFGSLGAKQVAFARMTANDFAIGGDLKAFLCAAVGLQLQFWFLPVTWHCFESSPYGPGLTRHFLNFSGKTDPVQSRRIP
jgi:hypothetical protein